MVTQSDFNEYVASQQDTLSIQEALTVAEHYGFDLQEALDAAHNA